MKVGLALYELLTGNSAVNTEVSGRIYPERAPEGVAVPYIVYSITSNEPSDNKERTPVDEAQVEIFSVASTYGDSNNLADMVRTALDRQGVSVDISAGTIVVQSIRYTNEYSEVSDDRKYYAQVQDYSIRITR